MTVALILLNWAVFILGVCDPALRQRAYAWGGMSGYYFLAGQWWRPLSAMFLHQAWWHLLFNTMFLFLLGRKVERALGHMGFLFLYLATGLAASLAAFLNPLRTAMGSSGAVFGIGGAFFILHYCVLCRVSPKARLAAVGWLLGMAVAYGPNTRSALAAHGIGLVAGFLCMKLAWSRRFRTSRRNRWKLQLCLAGCAVMLVATTSFIYPNPVALEADAYTRIDHGDYQQAVEMLAVLTRFFPTYETPYCARAFCYQRMERNDLAGEAIERGLVHCPDSFWLWQQRGETNLARGLLIRAQEDFEKAWRLSGGNDALWSYCQGRLSLWKGEYAQTVEQYTSALNKQWRAYDVLCGRGLAYCALGHLAEAEADWRQAIAGSNYPYHKGLLQIYLGFLELRRGHWEQAMKYANEKDALGRNLPLNGLLRLIATEKMGAKSTPSDKAMAIPAAQVYRHLHRSDLTELKALLPRDLWHYLDPIE
jgi:membrane associated rhomboid family serine protease/tetratricopeptide (TPR) repeat protein